MDSELNTKENNDGEWSSVGKGGKGGKKQKKKFKNAKTLSLQNFISENGGWSPGDLVALGDSKEDNRTYTPELTEDEELVKTSLLSFFTDLLRRLGPVKKDDMRIKSELDAVSDSGQILIKRYGSLRDFLIQDENIAIIDDYICLHGDVETARKLAITQMMEKASMSNHAALNGASDDTNNIIIQAERIMGIIESHSLANNSSGAPSRSTSVSKTNVWNTKLPPSMSTSSTGIDPLLNLPEVKDSLFDYKTVTSRPPVNPIQPPKTASIVSIPTSFPIPPPPLKVGGSDSISQGNGPPSLIKPNNGYSSSVGLGYSSEDLELNTGEDIRNGLHHGLYHNNADLLKRIVVQDKEITELKELVPKPEDLRKCEKLEGEVKALKEEVAMLKVEKLEEAQLAGKRHSTHIIQIQNEMEKKMLDARNVQHQLDMERVNNQKLTQRYNDLLKQAMSSLGSPYATPVYQTPSNNCAQFINPSSNVSSSSSMVSTVAAMAPSLSTSSTSLSTNRVNSMDSFSTANRVNPTTGMHSVDTFSLADSMRSIWNSPKKTTICQSKHRPPI